MEEIELQLNGQKVSRRATLAEARQNLQDKAALEKQLKQTQRELRELVEKVEADKRAELAYHGRDSQQLRSRLLMDRKAHDEMHQMEVKLLEMEYRLKAEERARLKYERVTMEELTARSKRLEQEGISAGYLPNAYFEKHSKRKTLQQEINSETASVKLGEMETLVKQMLEHVTRGRLAASLALRESKTSTRGASKNRSQGKGFSSVK